MAKETTPAIRVPLSKRVRFKIFKRDDFTCQYCGQKPPSVTLEVDHIIAVIEGGKNDEHNLLTACFDCNRGKGRESLRVRIASIDTKEKALILRENRAQVRAYEKQLIIDIEARQKRIADIVFVFEMAFPNWQLNFGAKQSIGRFLDKLPLPIVSDAMQKACDAVGSHDAFKYFCGICWKIIKAPR